MAHLACWRCDWRGALSPLQACPRCAGTLLAGHEGGWPAWDERRQDVWRYASWLPPVGRRIGLGEGGTPLLRSRALDGEVWLKNEAANPTLSFKDRPVAVATALGLELFEQLGRAPDAVVVPVGAGPLLAGIGKAFEELAAAGRSESSPRLYAVQAAGCAPLARAFAEGAPVRAWETPPATRAGGIADPLAGYAADGDRTLAAVRATGGAAIAVGEQELVAAADELARGDGLAVELSAAAAAAGHHALRAAGRIAAEETCVLVLTGHASKDPAGSGEPGDASLGLVAPGAVDDAEQVLQARRPPDSAAAAPSAR